jgi:hypothetical protein
MARLTCLEITKVGLPVAPFLILPLTDAILAYKSVREAVDSDNIWFFHISGKINSADVLTKFLGHITFWPLVKPFLFWHGQPAQVKTQFHFWHRQPTLVQSS